MIVNTNQAAAIIKKGGIVVFPTDTAFGVGCRIDDNQAVERLFKLKKRPLTCPVPVLVANITMAQKYLFSPLSQIVRHLMEDYWPGGLTIVYWAANDKKLNICPLVVSKEKKLGVRIPQHQIPLKIIEAVKVPILAPSANFYTHLTPYSFNDLDKDFINLTDGVVRGKCFHKKTSTVIDCTSHPVKILRLGTVNINQKYLK